jgi:hypothetical protein
MQTRERSCLPPFPAPCPGATRVPSTLLCYTFPVPAVQHRWHVPAERQCTSKRQGKVRERQAWNVWTWLKNVSGSLKGDDLGTGCERSSSMSNRISHKRSQRRTAGKKSGLSCPSLVRSTKNAPDCLMGNAIMSGNLAKRFVILTDTAHHIWPFFRWDAIVRLTWTRMLLCGRERGKTAEQVL